MAVRLSVFFEAFHLAACGVKKFDTSGFMGTFLRNHITTNPAVTQDNTLLISIFLSFAECSGLQ